MKTLAELNAIRDAVKPVMAMRKGSASEQSQYKNTVLICGGTGCTSSGSNGIMEALNEELVKNGIQDQVKVVLTGCFGLCALGPIMIVYPEGSFYSRVEPSQVAEIVKEHLVGGNVVKKYLYAETVNNVTGELLSLTSKAEF